MRRASIVIEKDENGFYAWHPVNCGMEGMIANIKEATELYLETLPPDDRAGLLSHEILTTARGRDQNGMHFAGTLLAAAPDVVNG